MIVREDNKLYKLVPMDDQEVLNKAYETVDKYREKYYDYKYIPREVLVNRVLKVDSMTEWEYCDYIFRTWVDWQGLYDAVSTQINCPYTSLKQFISTGMKLVKEAFDNKQSIETGYFKVLYLDEYVNEEGITEKAEISLDVIIYGTSHVLNEEERDYLIPEDDQTYNYPG